MSRCLFNGTRFKINFGADFVHLYRIGPDFRNFNINDGFLDAIKKKFVCKIKPQLLNLQRLLNVVRDLELKRVRQDGNDLIDLVDIELT